MIELGRLKIENRFMLAPMSMYSDIGLRKICRGYGCSYGFTEQIYASEFIKKDYGLKRKLDLFDDVGLQLITDSPSELKEAIRMVNEKEFYPGLKNVRSIDLNLGCPTPDVMAKNMGAALLNQPKRVRMLFKTLRKESRLPVSAKIRLAINSKHKKTKPYLRLTKIAEEEGLDFITIHLRTAGQLYSGEPDIEALKETRAQTKIKLVGNGGVHDSESAYKMLEHCDAVMIGQQALREPYIFKQLTDNSWKPDIVKEKKQCIEKYIKYSEEYNIGFQHLKIHLQSLLRGIDGQERTIREMTHTHSQQEAIALLNKLLKD